MSFLLNCIVSVLYYLQLSKSETVSFASSTPITRLSTIDYQVPYYGASCLLSYYLDTTTSNTYNWLSIMGINQIEVNIYDNKLNTTQSLPPYIKTSSAIGLPNIAQCTNSNSDVIVCYNVEESPLPSVYCNIYDTKSSKWSENIAISPTNNHDNGAFSPSVLCIINGYIVFYEYVSNYSMTSDKLFTQIHYSTLDSTGEIIQNDIQLLTNEYNISSIQYDPQQFIFVSNAKNSSTFFLLQTTEFVSYGITGSVSSESNPIKITNTFTVINESIGFSVYNNPLQLTISDDCCYVVGYGANVLSPLYFNVYTYSGIPISNMMNQKVTDDAYWYSFTELNMFNTDGNGDKYFVILYVTRDTNSSTQEMNSIDNSVWKLSYDAGNGQYDLNMIDSTPVSLQKAPANVSYTVTPCINVLDNELFVVTTTAVYNQYTPQPIFGETFSITKQN